MERVTALGRDAVRRSMELWVGCVAGAFEEQEFIGLLEAVGFENAR